MLERGYEGLVAKDEASMYAGGDIWPRDDLKTRSLPIAAMAAGRGRKNFPVLLRRLPMLRLVDPRHWSMTPLYQGAPK